MAELANLYATDIMQYSAAIQRGIRIMRINGVDDTEICFHAAQWGHTDYDDSSDDDDCGIDDNQVFNRNGGSIGFQQPTNKWYDFTTSPPNDSGDWVFSSRFEVENVGTTSGGSATEAGNADIVMATAPLREDVCEAVNRLLDYTPTTPPAVAASTYNNLATNPFNTDDVSFTSGTGRIGAFGRERCVTDPGGFNVYYKVILAR